MLLSPVVHCPSGTQLNQVFLLGCEQNTLGCPAVRPGWATRISFASCGDGGTSPDLLEVFCAPVIVP
jgi:hypothetical protein